MKSTTLRNLFLIALAGLALPLSPAHSADDAKSVQAAPDAAVSQKQQAARERLQAMWADLNLSPEQKEKLMPLLASEMEKLAALRADESLRPRQKLQRAKSLRDELTPRVKAILTPEQFAQWEKKRAEARDEFRGKLRERQG